MEPLKGAWAPLQLKTAQKWGVGELSVGAVGVAYGGISILDDSAVLSCSQTEATSIHSLEASESGKLQVEWTWEFLLLLILFLFAHKFHLLQHRILVATKGNAILPLMKKLINIHLPGNMICHELYMNTCSGGQTVSLCVQSI